MKPRSTQQRRDAYERGRKAETAAAWFLRSKGWRIKARRYRSKSGEVDVIARKDDLVIFVEVKARKRESDALDSVSYASQRRIEAAAEDWIAEQADYAALSWRFDVIAIVPARPPLHFENVW